jgi:hypothetical protein
MDTTFSTSKSASRVSQQSEEKGYEYYKEDEYNWEEIVKFSNESGRHDAPATDDLWFKFVFGSDGGTVSLAFMQAVLSLSFKHLGVKLLTDRIVKCEKIELLPLRSDPERPVATDFANAITFNPKNPKSKEMKN